MLPSPDILNDFEHGKFVLSNLAAKRAKQLSEGALPLVNVESSHPLTIALAEIAAGKIKAIMNTGEELPEVETISLFDETVPSELGLLLPALDETEVALISTATLVGEDDHEADPDAVVDEGSSLADLLGDGVDDEEPEVVAAEDDTLSLSDIADEETAAENENED
jgi:DNA-directed RNA polymerase subunit omega